MRHGSFLGRWGHRARWAVAPLLILLILSAAPAAADPAGAPSPQTEPANSASQPSDPILPGPAGPPRINMAAWAWQSLGLFYGSVFFGLTLVLAALLVVNMLGVRREAVVPPSLLPRLAGLLGIRQYRQAYEVASADGSLLARMAAAGIARLPLGRDQAAEAVQRAAEEGCMEMEQRLSYLALLGTVAPMVGLLGTVHGMIASFSLIALRSVTPRPWELAGGISKALFTTLVGLAIAIPAIAAYNILRNRVARLLLEAGILGDELLVRLSPPEGTTAPKATP